MKSFQNMYFHGQFRDYQQNVLDNLNKYLEDGKIHIVAAPGSGKTILGLELIKRLGNPAIILSPTTTIRQQWKQRLKDAFIDCEENVDEYVSCDLNNIKLLNSITYQALYSIINKIKLREDNDETIDYININLFEIIKNKDIKTICLDEAHHLQNEWQKALELFISKLDKDIKLISLTATPPYDASAFEWQRYISICGDIDDEIFVPELVKEKTLCPHQDYIYFNYPKRFETDELVDHQNKTSEAIYKLINLPVLNDLCNKINFNYKSILDDLFTNAKSYIALLVLFKYANMPINKKLIKTLTNSSNLPNYNLQYAQDAFQFLIDDKHLCTMKEKEEIIIILKKFNLFDKNKISFELNEKLKRKIISSVGKLDSIIKIVNSEHYNLLGSLRMLILTDYIKLDKLNMIGTNESFKSISVVSVFETLRRNLNEISIGVLSGSLVILSSTVINHLDTLCNIEEIDYTKELISSTNYYLIKFKGTNKDKVSIITKLFEEGFIQVLIGTKSLLGEGWDSPCINSLILASFIGSFMLSNQMRGRAIRINKYDSQKTANIWHLVTIEPDYLFEDNIKNSEKKKVESYRTIKSYDFEILKRRFDCFVGPSYENNEIKSGIERISIIKPPYKIDEIDKINNKMLEMSNNRYHIQKKWDEALLKTSKLSYINEIPKDRKIPQFTIINIILITIILSLLSVIIGNIIKNTLIFANNSNNIYQLLFSVICFFLLLSISGKFIYRFVLHLTPRKSIKSVATAVLNALKELNKIQKASKVKLLSNELGIYINITLVNGSLHEQNLFNKAIEEIYSIIENPRYIMMKKGILGYNYSLSFSCPSIIGMNKENVQLFKKYLTKIFGKMDFIYTRNVDGRKTIIKCKKKSYITLNSSSIGIKKIVNNWQK